MKRLAVFSILISSLSLSLFAMDMVSKRTQNGKLLEYAADSVLVSYKPNFNQLSISQTGKLYGTSVTRRLSQLRVDVLKVPPNETVDSFIEKLKNRPEFEYVERDIIYRANLTPNDPQFSTDQYYAEDAYINMEPAWDITTGNNNVVVAVIDTGVNLTHPDLANNLWVNPGPLTTTSGLHGASTIFLDNNGDGDCTDDGDICPSDDPTDDHAPPPVGDDFHGSHAAGIIAATANNNTNMAGICFDCRIMALKALDSDGSGAASWIANAILYAVNNGASIINMSLGSDFPSSTIESAVKEATKNNVVTVAAAGNTNTLANETSCAIEFPAAIDDVIAVGATDRTNPDGLAIFSCTGQELDLMAPGVSILGPSGGSTTSSLSGTSFATPMVAGVAGLLRSLNPAMSINDVRRYLNFFATDLGTTGYDTTFGFGRLNALATLQAAQAGQPFVSNPVDPGNTFAYPNPYNPKGGQNVTLSLPSSLGTAGLKIQIYTLAGERIKTLTDTNEWDGRNERGNIVASGLYYYFAQTDSGDIKGKLTILK